MSYSSNYYALKKKKKEEPKKDIAPLFTNKTTAFFDRDIAPVMPTKTKEKKEEKTTTTDKRTWFQKGALEEEANAKNVGKAILGTGADAGGDFLSGIVGIGEKVVDFFAGIAPLVAQGQYYQNGGGYNIQADKIFEDSNKAFKQEAEKFIAKDLYDEHKVSNAILSGLRSGAYLSSISQSGGQVSQYDWELAAQMRESDREYLDNEAEKDSFLGDRSDSLVESAGVLAAQMGLQAVGVPWFVTAGVTTYGGEMESALNQGATLEEANASGAISAGAEILTEKMFGGDVFTKNAGADLATSRITTLISSKALQKLAKAGVDVGGEGLEEAASQFISNLGTSLYKEENLGEILFSEEALDGYIESMIGGTALGGIMTGANVVSAKKQGVDYVSGLTENEQKVVDKVYKDALAEAEKNGKVTNKQKAKIYDEVLEKMDKGYISTDTIEEIFGDRTGYDSLVQEANEFNALYTMESGKMTRQQQVRLAELEAKNEANPYETAVKTAKDQVSQGVFELVKDSRLAESYNEKTRKGQKFEADLTQYDKKYHATIQKAIDSGILNNSNRTHEFVDIVSKISADKGVSFDFANNEKIKETGFAVEGMTVDGYITEDGITINIDSPKAWQSTVGHEVTHILEGTDLYNELKTTLFDHAKSKGEYQTRYDSVVKRYKEGTDYEAELTADLVGDYLFQDADFIRKLSTENRNVFQKIYDEIKYLCKVATAGTKEARDLEKVRKAFEEAYRAGSKAQTETKYSITEPFTDSNGTQFENAVLLDTDFFEGTPPRNWGDRLRVMVNERAGSDPFILPITDENGNTTLLQFASPNERVTKDGSSNHRVLDKLSLSSENISKLAVVHIDEIVSVSEENYPYYTDEHNHQWLDEKGWLHRNANVINRKNGNIYNLTIDIAKASDGRTILYATDGKIKKVGSVQVNSLKIKGSGQDSDFLNNLPQGGSNVNTKYSLSDGTKDVAKGQQLWYNNKRGEEYVRTDEFRSLQAESQRMSDEEWNFYLRGGKNEDVRRRVSTVLQRQMDAWRSSGGTHNGRLRLSGKGNQFNMYEGVDPSLFHDIFEVSRKYLQNGELVDLHEIETTEDGIGYNDCYNYLSEDGLSGFSITPDGDLISVFNASGKGGFLRAISDTVKAKAKTLDCYASPNQNLMEMYQKFFGFKTASVMDYNMEFDHDSIAENHNHPKIAFMVNTESDVETRSFTEEQYAEALEYRNSFVNQATSNEAASFMPQNAGNPGARRSVSNGEQHKEYGNFHTSTTELKYAPVKETSEPTKPTISKPETVGPIAEDFSAFAPTNEVAGLFSDDLAPAYAPIAEQPTAPVAEKPIAPVKEQHEAIKPRKEPQPKMVRADNADQKTAKILTEDPQKPKQKSAVNWIKEHVLRHGAVIEDIALETGNRELQAKFDNIRRAEGVAQEMIGKGKGNTKALLDIWNRVERSGKLETFQNYLYHMLNIDRMTLDVRYGTLNKAVFGDEITAETSAKYAERLLKNNPEFKVWAQQCYDYCSSLRQDLVDGGVISQELTDLLAEMYPHYVPIGRVDHNGKNVDVPLDTKKTGINAPIKRATGGNSDIRPVFKVMAERTIQTYKAIAKNRFGVELKNTLGTVIDSDTYADTEVMDSVAQHEELLQEGKDGQAPTFTVFENGEKVTFEITEDIYEALKPSQFTYTNKTLNKIGDVRRDMLTTYSPSFPFTNPFKDMGDIIVNSQHPVRTYAEIPNAIGQMISKGKWYQERKAHGGAQDTYFAKRAYYDSKSKEFKRQSRFSKVAGFPFEKVRQANEFFEQVPRLAEYIASRKMGRSIDVSMLDSARVTTNFGAAGDFTNMLNRNGFTFLGASVEGFNQQVRNVREAKAEGLKGWAKLAGKYLVAGLPVILLNHALWDDDEDYEELSDYVKQNYYIVGKFGDGQFVRIPKGRAVAVIQNAFEQMENLITGNDEVDLKAFADLAFTNLAPNDPLNNNVLSPAIQTLNNRTWYGEDLVPTRLQDLPAAEQYDESTDSISKWLGEKAGEIGIDISPVKINYLLDQYSGGVGDMLLPMITPEAESGDNSFAGNMIAPLKDKFTTDSTMNNQNVSNFYDTVDKLTTNAKSSKATDEDILKSKYINSVSSEMSELYKRKREIQNSGYSDSYKYEKVRDIQKQIDELAEESLATYDNVNIVGDYATVGDRHFRQKDGEWQKITDKQLEKQEEVTSTLGISGAEYWSNKEEYDYAYEYPDKYAVAKSVGGYDSYKTYTSELYDIKADKDSNGKSINGSRKDQVLEYINNLDADYGERIILFKSEYPSDDTYNYEIIDYLNSRPDISYEEMVAILKELGFNVDSNGNITWD